MRINTKAQMLCNILTRKRSYVSYCKPHFASSKYLFYVLKNTPFMNKNPHIKAKVLILCNMNKVILHKLLERII